MAYFRECLCACQSTGRRYGGMGCGPESVRPEAIWSEIADGLQEAGASLAEAPA